MGVQVYRETNPVQLHANPDAAGVSWVGASGGTGTKAIAAGGWVTTENPSTGGAATGATSLPVFVKPADSDASYMLVGTIVPAGGKVWIGGLWCTYWEED